MHPVKLSILVPFLFSLGLILLNQGCGSSPANVKPGGLQIGDKVDDFSLMDDNGQIMKLSDVPSGWYLVIVLYRGYWCNACRDQLFKLKEDFPRFAPLHATLVAVSTDSVEDSATINQQWRFPFPLLSDPHLSLITALGALHAKGHGIHDIAHPAIIILDPQKIISYKIIGQNPIDLPNDNELIYILQQMELDLSKNQPGGSIK